jgi:hypothetical protein
MLYAAQYWSAFGLTTCFVVGTLVFAVLTILSSRGIVKIPRPLMFAVLVIAMMTLLAQFKLDSSRSQSQRQELKRVETSTLSEFILESGEKTVLVTNAADLRAIFGELQTVGAVAAHHSHPTKTFDIKFIANNQRYYYRVSRDSQDASEFWVISMNEDGTEGSEIGRVHSVVLETLLESLLKKSSHKSGAMNRAPGQSYIFGYRRSNAINE